MFELFCKILEEDRNAGVCVLASAPLVISDEQVLTDLHKSVTQMDSDDCGNTKEFRCLGVGGFFSRRLHQSYCLVRDCSRSALSKLITTDGVNYSSLRGGRILILLESTVMIAPEDDSST
jgi:hypothetical protein